MFTCDSCGEIDHVLIDGYGIGDRVLEGVMFRVVQTPEGAYQVTLNDEDDRAYFEQNHMSVEEWCKDMTIFAEAHADIATCSKCKGDVVMPGFEVDEEEFTEDSFDTPSRNDLFEVITSESFTDMAIPPKEDE